MNFRRFGHVALVVLVSLLLAGCGESRGLFGSFGRLGQNLFGGAQASQAVPAGPPANATAGTPPPVRVLAPQGGGGFLGLRRAAPDPTAGVNAHIWAGALDILGFLPVRSADPHAGIILTGFGRAPGASIAYRAEVRVTSGVLDASSLELALFTQSGRASAATTKSVAEAIRTRARQLRIAAQ